MYFKRKSPEWKADESGATAVEFALVGVPFIIMVIGIIEMALMFTANSLLEASTSEAARQIRIGAVQQTGGEDAFKDALCGFAETLIPCDDIQYQVQSVDSFEDAQDFPEATFDEEGNLQDQNFDAGGVNDIVLIRVVYKYPIKTPLMQLILTNNNDGNRILMSTVVLQTEPYQFISN